ncbi:MAG: hypothetical protein A2571_01780 [Candidatus Vogelbacteria bacterium RIFOXYD1_FULL_44_32]|uniref:Thioredoxin domain-containing protein n=1 Tax=Candidatus Vogelbacteria bacterium RIFOXYD1_FULL_44_32 TaxID=1802438 RepID=A0A1G2QDG7_9BACT|nr:MAG: hypothetical protein A2571_01780 [Candidatus Vogelbacteria bacterium RIFOXYD1_FULL_44_32]
MTDTKESKQERDARKEAARATRQMGWAVFLVTGAILLVFAGVWLTNRPENTEDIGDVATISATDHTKGATTTPKAVLIEYSDFQCPACAAYEPLVNELASTYGPQGLTVVYRHYPLPQHNKALLMAKASEAASGQGKFWEMHDLIFAEQADWSKISVAEVEKTITAYAKKLDLDLTKFNTALNSKVVANKIQADVASAKTAKVVGTPTFFLNGQEVVARTSEDFARLIEQSLATTTANAKL